MIKASVAGASVRELCTLGDKLLLEETAKVFKKEKELKKGIAFPTCLSVNNCICHFSPLESDTDVVLKDGDVVKMWVQYFSHMYNLKCNFIFYFFSDLGAHVDGFIAAVAHTVIVGSNKITGRQADALLAAHYASEAALRLMKPGTEV